MQLPIDPESTVKVNEKLPKKFYQKVTKRIKSILEKNRRRQMIGLKDVPYTTSIFNLLRIKSERNHQDAVVLHLHQFTKGFFLSQFKFEHDNS